MTNLMEENIDNYIRDLDGMTCHLTPDDEESAELTSHQRMLLNYALANIHLARRSLRECLKDTS